jgi:hypothetical protein
MNQHSFLQSQVTQLRRLLAGARDNPILAPQLQQRLEDVEGELKTLESRVGTPFPVEIAPPRVAIFLKGGGVPDSDGIRAALAGEALIQYERMFTEQALHDERAAARTAGRSRRRRGSSTPSLLFTGTARGSFGLEFLPQQPEDEALLPIHAQALANVAEALVRVSADDPGLEKAIEGISPRVLVPMKKFLKTLAQYDVDLRLAFSDAPSKAIAADQIKRAAERLEREWEEVELRVKGVFRGLTRESTIFDVLPDEGGLITGTIADSLTEEDFDRIDALTNQRCVAELQVTTLRPIGGAPRVTYLLLDAKPEEPATVSVPESPA